MNLHRHLPIWNAAGVLALSTLCVVQWRTDARQHLDRIARETELQQLAAKWESSSNALRGCTADLETFRQQIIRQQKSLRDRDERLAETEQQVRLLTAERDRCQEGIAQWQRAAAARDQRVAEANTRIEELARERNEAVGKYNRLVEDYNAVVTNLNAAVARLKEVAGTKTASNK